MNKPGHRVQLLSLNVCTVSMAKIVDPYAIDRPGVVLTFNTKITTENESVISTNTNNICKHQMLDIRNSSCIKPTIKSN